MGEARNATRRRSMFFYESRSGGEVGVGLLNIGSWEVCMCGQCCYLVVLLWPAEKFTNR